MNIIDTMCNKKSNEEVDIFHKREGFFIKPQQNSDVNIEIESSLNQLKKHLTELNSPVVLRASFLVDASTDEEYKRVRELIDIAISTSGIKIPSYSVIAQNPDLPISHVLEVELLDVVDGIDVELKSEGEISYWMLNYNGTRELVLSGCGTYCGTIEEMSRATFEVLDTILKRESMEYSDIVRQWNYIGKITLEVENRQNYQVFNDVRSVYYSDVEWSRGYPAATGIGMVSSGVLIELNAIQSSEVIDLVTISNPRQIDAHKYSGGVLVGDAIEAVKSRTSPKFERAKGVVSNSGGVVYISGTASIIGEETVGLGDVVEQTAITMRNIELLIEEASQPELSTYNAYGSGELSKLRVYVKYSSDDAKVREYMTQNWDHIPFVIVCADVCRDNLLVEIEGEYRY